MVATFLLPPPGPPDISGGAPLPTIQEGQVYREDFTDRSAMHRVALGGKIYNNDCGTRIAQNVSQTTIHLQRTTTQQKNVNVFQQELSSFVSQMQRMALDNTRLLEKFFAHQEQQAQKAQRADRKARKAVNKARALQLRMMSLMRIMSQSSTSGRNTHKTSPVNLPNENPSDRKDNNAPSQYKLSKYSKSDPLQCRSIKNDSYKSGNKDLSMSHTTRNTPPCANMTTKNPLCAIMIKRQQPIWQQQHMIQQETNPQTLHQSSLPNQ
jgi:hypothetical protein